MGDKLDDIQETQTEHSYLLNAHTKLHNSHTTTLNAHTETLNAHTTTLATIETNTHLLGRMSKFFQDCWAEFGQIS